MSGGIRLPWDYSNPVGPDVHPNVPCPEGIELGSHLARFCDQAEAKKTKEFGELPPRCVDCAYRAGTIPNGCLSTVADAMKCWLEREPFFCHHGVVDGEPTRLCRGWVALASDETLDPVAQRIADAANDGNSP